MTLVDFYVLQATDIEAQHHFACRLVEKAVNQGNRVLIATKTPEESDAINQMLWSFRPDAFVPNARENTDRYASEQVGISHGEHPGDHHDVLVNLRLNVPEQFSRFKRLAEIVIQEHTALENSRTSYAFFKKRGYPINTHKLK